MITLDLKDKKLLTALDENSRYTNAQLARKVQLSKPAIEYRIKRLQKNNIIFKYYTSLNITKLRYSQHTNYLKFQNHTHTTQHNTYNTQDTKPQRNRKWDPAG